MRLLWLPAVACTRRVAPMPRRSISLVVVLPTDPVTPTTSQFGWASRQAAARASRNASQSSSAASRTLTPVAARLSSRLSATGSDATTTAAPAWAADKRYEFPLTFSPAKATKSEPSWTSRESMTAAPATSRVPRWSSRAFVAATICSTESLTMSSPSY